MSQPKEQKKKLTASGFFVMRTPLLPFSALLVDAPGDENQLHAWLLAWRERPEVKEALHIASPALGQALVHLNEQPSSEKAIKARRSLVRYLYRMAARATPFGIFAGCSVGEPGESSRLDVPGLASLRRRARVDYHVISALEAELGRDPALRARWRFAPNSSLYRLAGKVRYVEAHTDTSGGRQRRYTLAAAVEDAFLAAVLEAARPGATLATLEALLTGMDAEISAADAREYLFTLIDSQVLVPASGPAITGELSQWLEALRADAAASALAAAAVSALDETEAAFAALEASPIGQGVAAYARAENALAALPFTLEKKWLVQVDLFKPSETLALSPRVLGEIQKGIELAHRLSTPVRETPFDRFRRAFAERYGERVVPLAEVLDEESGIGFERSRAPGAEALPLLAGLSFARAGSGEVPWGRREIKLLQLLVGARARGEMSVTLTEADVAALAGDAPLPPPDGCSAGVSLRAPSREAIERGDFQVYFKGIEGPSGAKLFGRFAAGDARLKRLVEGHLRREEAARPGAIFAEVVHLPEGRAGNVILRPVLRDYEIAYLGRSGAPPDRHIRLDDLMVSVQGGRIVVSSRRLGREIVPRLTSAHSYGAHSLGVYRFLCELQHQGLALGMGFSWFPFGDVDFLPRVVYGRLILALAQWMIPADVVTKLKKMAMAERLAALEGLRRERKIPRFAALIESENSVALDLANAYCVDAFITDVTAGAPVVLRELVEEPDALLAEGPDGRYVHELHVPFVVAAPEPPGAAPIERKKEVS